MAKPTNQRAQQQELEETHSTMSIQSVQDENSQNTQQKTGRRSFSEISQRIQFLKNRISSLQQSGQTSNTVTTNTNIIQRPPTSSITTTTKYNNNATILKQPTSTINFSTKTEQGQRYHTHSNNNNAHPLGVYGQKVPRVLVNTGLNQQNSVGGSSISQSINTNNNNNNNKEKEKRPALNTIPEHVGQPFEVNSVPFLPLDVVGRGGSGTVYKVVGPDRQVYALKHISFERENNSTLRTIKKELQHLRRLKGSMNIIELIDSQILSNRVINMVFEYGEVDLHKLIQKEKGLGPNQIRLYWQEMLHAVQTIHDARIVHGDLKPANFLLVKGVLKLIDFGIAENLADDKTHVIRDSMVGTINYMPPESFMPRSPTKTGSEEHFKLGIQSDVWALGCILYQMAFGKTPFHNIQSFPQKVAAILNHKYEIEFPTTDNDLKNVLKNCLDRDRANRPTIPDLLQHSFLTRTSAYNNSSESSQNINTTLNVDKSTIVSLLRIGMSLGMSQSRSKANLSQSELNKIGNEILSRIRSGFSLKINKLPSFNNNVLNEKEHNINNKENNININRQ